jgi:cytochrome c biogenesis protein CcmG, thiol:disulfide interchange protein DsbE
MGGMSRARLAVIGGVAAVVIAALSIVGGALAAGPGKPRVLRPAENFTLSLLGDPARRLSLASLHARPVILNFFASWCTPCRKETPMLARFYHSRHQQPLIIGIDANDSRSNALAFVRRNGVSYPVLTDPFPAKTAIAYGVPGLPATFFLDARHRIVRRIYGAVTLPELTAGTAAMTDRAS